MAKLRYAKTLEQVKQAAEANPEFLKSTVRSLRAVYETDAAIVAALTPQPLEPIERPEVCVTFSQVAIHITPDFTFEIGSAVFGVKVRGTRAPARPEAPGSQRVTGTSGTGPPRHRSTRATGLQHPAPRARRRRGGLGPGGTHKPLSQNRPVQTGPSPAASARSTRGGETPTVSSRKER